MRLNSNPFYILEVNPDASRREIIAAAEEKAFYLDASICSEAQNTLINPSKRLEAELDWFLDIDNFRLQSIRAAIEKGEPISTDGLSSLSRLNALLHNLMIDKNIDAYEAGFSILEIDDLFSSFAAESITTAINAIRGKAGMGQVQVQDIVAQLIRKRESIRSALSDKLFTFDEETYVELITILAEKYLANKGYTDGAILSDVMDQYEIRMQASMDEKTSDIERQIQSISQLTNSETIKNRLSILIRTIEAWDRIAQPLQLKAQVSGMPHTASEKMARKIRDFALHLNNDMHETESAFELVTAMAAVFAELEDLSNRFTTDSNVLGKMVKENEDDQALSTMIGQLKQKSDYLKETLTVAAANDYLYLVKRIDSLILSRDWDNETKTAHRTNLCNTARETAISLHYGKNQPSLAYALMCELCTHFMGLSTVASKLLTDRTLLSLFAQPGSETLLKNATSSHGYQSSASVPIQQPKNNYEVTTVQTNNVTSSSNHEDSKQKRGWVIAIVAMITLVVVIGVVVRNSKSSKWSSYVETSDGSNAISSSTNKETGKITNSSYTVSLYQMGGSSGTLKVSVKAGEEMPSAKAPSRIGYDFGGFFSSEDGNGTMYYDANMNSTHTWDKKSDGKIYAYWIEHPEYKFNSSLGMGEKVYVDIVSISPAYGIYSEKATTYSKFVCSCRTSTNETVWIYMRADEYRDNFDKNVSITVNDDEAETIKFSRAVRVHGETTHSLVLLANLVDKLPEIIIRFSTVDK